MMEQKSSSLFNERYYAQNCGEPYARNETWLGMFDHIANRIITDLFPKKILDAGCAWGFLVEALRNRGVEAYGIDISEYAISQVAEPIKPYCRIESIAHNFDGVYDLIVCIEVVEHMEKLDAECGIKNLCEHTDRILFSSSPNDYSEATHFNVQPVEVWAREFARYGFFRDLDFDATFITPWAMLLKKAEIPAHDLVYQYERKNVLLKKENQDLREKVNKFEQVPNLTLPSTLIITAQDTLVKVDQNSENLGEISKQRDTYFRQLSDLLESEEWQTFQEFKKIHND